MFFFLCGLFIVTSNISDTAIFQLLCQLEEGQKQAWGRDKETGRLCVSVCKEREGDCVYECIKRDREIVCICV